MKALHIFGAPITQLSTSRLFAWLVERGTYPLSVEWVNDYSCNAIFRDTESAFTGLQNLLVPPLAELPDQALSTEDAMDDPISMVPLPQLNAMKTVESLLEEGRDMNDLGEEEASLLGQALLTSRKLRPIPLKLFTPIERETGEAMLREKQEASQPEADDEMMEEAGREDPRLREQGDEDFQTRRGEVIDSRRRKPKAGILFQPDAASVTSGQAQDLRKLTSSLYARFAVSNFDYKKARAHQESEWYRRHGYDAGRQVVPWLEVGSKGTTSQIAGREADTRELLAQRRSERDRSASPDRLRGKLSGVGEHAASRARRGGSKNAHQNDLLSRSRRPTRGRGHAGKGRGGTGMASAWSSDEEEDEDEEEKENEDDDGDSDPGRNGARGQPSQARFEARAKRLERLVTNTSTQDEEMREDRY